MHKGLYSISRSAEHILPERSVHFPWTNRVTTIQGKLGRIPQAKQSRTCIASLFRQTPNHQPVRLQGADTPTRFFESRQARSDFSQMLLQVQPDIGAYACLAHKKCSAISVGIPSVRETRQNS